MTESADQHETGDPPPETPGILTGLSARLLVMTVAFVMLAELLIWTPSIAQFRKTYLEDQVARAHLAMIAVGSLENADVNMDLENELLFHTGTYGIVLNLTDQRMLMVGKDMPPAVDVEIDMSKDTFFGWIGEAFMTLAQDDNRVLRVIGTAKRDPSISIEVIMDETPMRAAMYDYSRRILGLSIVISLFTALLVFLSLQWLMVRPVLRMARSLARFRDNPEADHGSITVTDRTDEIGLAQRELFNMQEQVRLALRQKSRLATLGEAVAKINHDLRNTLATAVLAFDRLAEVDDPEVKRLSPRLYKAITRATKLCSQTLEYVGTSDIRIRRERFHLAELVAEIAAEVREYQIENAAHDTANDKRRMAVENRVVFEVTVDADRIQLFRAIYNLALNADAAGATQLNVTCSVQPDGTAVIDLADDGPGMPENVLGNLFRPFSSGRKGGTGLGLVIARDIARAHNGDVELASTGAGGTTFRVTLPGATVEEPIVEAS